MKFTLVMFFSTNLRVFFIHGDGDRNLNYQLIHLIIQS